MKKLKVGVIGIGRLGSIHARVYKELDSVELVGICDINPEKLKSATNQYAVPTFLNHKELISEVDAISIAVPTNKHYEVAKDFINKGIHILIEKPITNNLEQAEELINLAQKNKVILQVGHVERFNSAFTAIEKIVKNPRFIECHRLSPFPHRSLDIGVVLDVMIHDIDIVLGLVKSQIKRVEAMGVAVLTPYEDIANVRLTFENGCVCNLTASRISEESMRKIRIFLADTYISLDYGSQEALLYKKEKGQIIKESLPIEKEEPLKTEIESFIDCIMFNRRPLVSGEEAYQALQLSDKILRKIWGKKVFVVAGEVSGDIHAAGVIRELRVMNPSLKFMGLGGKHMEEEGVSLFFDLTKIAVVGFTEVLKNLLLFRKIFYDFIKRAEQEKPDVIILVDYPGFNLRLAKELKKRGFKIIYYISPQIWAWGEKRIDAIKETVDKMIVLFDFEKDLYQKENIDVDFVGHPLLDQANQTLTRDEFIKSLFVEEGRNPIITLSPGSRNNEVEKILPIMLDSAKLIYREFPKAQFLIVSSPNIKINSYHSLIKKFDLPIRLLDRERYNAIANSDLSLSTSGTVTLEAAILNTPMIIIYKVTFLTWAYAKSLIKIPYIGLVNVVAGRQIVPEFVQFKARPKLIAKEAIQLLKDRERYNTLKKELSGIKTHLGSPGASRRAAEKILALL